MTSWACDGDTQVGRPTVNQVPTGRGTRQRIAGTVALAGRLLHDTVGGGRGAIGNRSGDDRAGTHHLTKQQDGIGGAGRAGSAGIRLAPSGGCSSCDAKRAAACAVIVRIREIALARICVARREGSLRACSSVGEGTCHHVALCHGTQGSRCNPRARGGSRASTLLTLRGETVAGRLSTSGVVSARSAKRAAGVVVRVYEGSCTGDIAGCITQHAGGGVDLEHERMRHSNRAEDQERKGEGRGRRARHG